jgi:RNA polymerase sigma factor (sigma-70 family)
VLAANGRGATMDAVQAHRPDSDAEVAESVLPTTDFVDCYRTHYRRLMRALQLSGANTATSEDIAQEAFARALVHWRRIRRGPNPPGYVYTTGFRLLQRAQRREAPLDAPATAVALPAPPAASTTLADPTGSAATTVLAIEGALASMPPRRRACAVMCLIVGIPVADAAETLGIAPGTVRKHIEEARHDLRAACDPPP